MSQTQKLQRDWHCSPLAYMDRDIAVKVPAELREVPQWITWKAGAVDADGKFQKLPAGKDGTGDEWQRSHQWYSFDDAIAAAEKRRHSGVGLVLPVRLSDGSHLVALDYDTVDLTPGVGNERLQEIKDSHKQFKSPYIEESPSGQGLRLFVRCANSVPQISASNPLGGKDELFCASGRWVTVTGRKLGGTGITEATSEIQSLAVLLNNRSKVKKARATKQKAAKEPKPAGFAVAPLSPLMHLVAKGWAGWPEQKICDGDGREAMMLAYAGYLRGTGHPQADIERLCIEANSKHYEDLLDHDVVLDRARRFEVKSTESEQQSESEGVTETRPAWVITLNSRFAVVRIGSSVLIFDEQTPVETPNGVSHGPGYLDIQAFRQIHSGLHTPSPSPESRAQPLANAWLAHPARRQYQGAVFSPGRKTPDHILNLWSGFGVQPFAGDVGPWLHVLENIAPEAITRTYVLNWLAHKVQNPGDVPGTILLVNGKKGSGKNSLFDPIVHIFGAYGRVFDDAEQIAGRFTGHLQTVAFAVLDEALFIGNGQQADRIKSRVTATSMTFEAKGRDPIQGVNHCAYISLSNHSHVWQATIDERRAVVVEASEKLVDARKFWTTYHAWLDGDGPAALLHYLQNLDVSSFDPRVIPKGTALRQQIEQTALKDPAAAWWHTVLSEGAISYRNGVRTNLAENDETEVSKATLRESFMESTPRAQAGDWMSAMRKLRGWVGDSGLKAVKRGTGTNRVSMVVLPSLSDLQKAFEDAVGVRITWVVNE